MKLEAKKSLWERILKTPIAKRYHFSLIHPDNFSFCARSGYSKGKSSVTFTVQFENNPNIPKPKHEDGSRLGAKLQKLFPDYDVKAMGGFYYTFVNLRFREK